MISRCFVCALLLMQTVTAVACESTWNAFANSPTTATYKALTSEIERSKIENRIGGVRPSSQNVNKLVVLIENNNAFAIDVAFLSLDLLDGGDLEDVIRSLGKLSETDPKLFLTSLQKYSVSEYRIRRLVTMLPLETVDNFKVKVRMVQRRIDSLSSINEPSLISIRDKALSDLREYHEKLLKLAN